LGAAAGGIIGHGQGAGIGAALGAAGGALIGSQIEKKPQGTQAASAQQMSVMDVVKLKKDGAPDDVIIDEIKMTNSKFNLSAESIDYLQKQGVGNRVIDVMMGK
jgi:uncharacterized protein YcfJ